MKALILTARTCDYDCELVKTMYSFTILANIFVFTAICRSTVRSRTVPIVPTLSQYIEEPLYARGPIHDYLQPVCIPIPQNISHWQAHVFPPLLLHLRSSVGHRSENTTDGLLPIQTRPLLSLQRDPRETLLSRRFSSSHWELLAVSSV